MTVNSWSYSALSQFETCPAQYQYARIARLPTKPKPYFEKGIRVHAALERYVKCYGAVDLSDEVKRERAFVEELAALPSHKAVEEKWAFAPNWGPIDWSRGYFRAVIDVLVDYADGTLEIIDWKTGKRYETNDEQMEVFALATMHRFPHRAWEVTTRLVYVESGGQEIGEFNRARDFERLDAKWAERSGRLFRETQWLPKPSAECHFCDFAKSKGGPCRYG